MTDWFQWYVQESLKQKGWATFRDRYLCPCCFMPTLGARGVYDLCQICDWEDDGQDSDDADVVRGGPNGDYSLKEARENFNEYFTMYRPSDCPAFELEQIDRPAKEQLHRLFSEAMWKESNELWQHAVTVEQELKFQQAKRYKARH